MSTIPGRLNLDPVTHEHFVDGRICVFCEPPATEVLAETANFYLTLDANPLMEGHLDIHSKQHIGCSAEIEPEHQAEYQELKAWSRELISSLYGQASMYEHGRAGHCGLTTQDGIICHHFHMHVLPLAIDIAPVVSKAHQTVKLGQAEPLTKLYEVYDQYLYFENSLGERYFFVVDDTLPSHYLRTVIAESIGAPERADWSRFFDRESMNRFKTKVKMSQFGS